MGGRRRIVRYMQTEQLTTPAELDRILRYPHGRSRRFAKSGRLPCVKLPDDEIRFTREMVNAILAGQYGNPMEDRQEARHAG